MSPVNGCPHKEQIQQHDRDLYKVAQGREAGLTYRMASLENTVDDVVKVQKTLVDSVTQFTATMNEGRGMKTLGNLLIITASGFWLAMQIFHAVTGHSITIGSN